MAQRDAAAPAAMTPAATAAALFTMVLWASAFVAIRQVGESFRPGSLALGRLLIGAVVLLAVVVIRREGLPPRPAWPGIAGMGVFWFGLYMVALNWGEKHTDAGIAALLIGTGPLFVALLAGVYLREGFPRPLLAGIAVAFTGAALAGFAGGGSGTAITGVLLCLAAAAGHAVGATLQKPALTHASPLQVTAYAAAVGAVACLPFSEQLAHDLTHASVTNIAGVLYLGLLPTALAFWTWSYALAHMPAGRLAATTYIVPTLTVLMAWPLLGEIPTIPALLGGILCLAGVAIANRKSPHHRPAGHTVEEAAAPRAQEIVRQATPIPSERPTESWRKTPSE